MTATGTDDGLLGALDQLTNTIYWYRDRYPLRSDTALVEALGDWVSEHSAEHNQSQPFTTLDAEATTDTLATVLTAFLTAVAHVTASGARPGISVTTALTEALREWATAHAAEHHQDQPFQRPPSDRA